jgi:hypothetical protein
LLLVYSSCTSPALASNTSSDSVSCAHKSTVTTQSELHERSRVCSGRTANADLQMPQHGTRVIADEVSCTLVSTSLTRSTWLPCH